MNRRGHIIPPSRFGYTSENDHRICDETTPFLNLDKLREEERSTEKTRTKIYKLILSKCHSKIRKVNNKTDQRECFFDIPIFIPGYPVYSVLEAKAFVLSKLNHNGIYANDVGENRIYISWKPNDVNYDQYKVTSEKMMPRNNVYKVGISPLDTRHQQKPKEQRKAKIWPEDGDNKVSMFQYDVRLGDMIPVNTKKMSKQYPELSRKNKKPSFMRKKNESDLRKTSSYQRPPRRRSRNDAVDLDNHYFSGDDVPYDHRYH